jgi:hypothetical protein
MGVHFDFYGQYFILVRGQPHIEEQSWETNESTLNSLLVVDLQGQYVPLGFQIMPDALEIGVEIVIPGIPIQGKI